MLHDCREPRHEAFGGRNVWSLFNAFTEALKDGSLQELPKRTEALHGYQVTLDRESRIHPKALDISFSSSLSTDYGVTV